MVTSSEVAGEADRAGKVIRVFCDGWPRGAGGRWGARLGEVEVVGFDGWTGAGALSFQYRLRIGVDDLRGAEKALQLGGARERGTGLTGRWLRRSGG